MTDKKPSELDRAVALIEVLKTFQQNIDDLTNELNTASILGGWVCYWPEHALGAKIGTMAVRIDRATIFKTVAEAQSHIFKNGKGEIAQPRHRADAIRHAIKHGQDTLADFIRSIPTRMEG